MDPLLSTVITVIVSLLSALLGAWFGGMLSRKATFDALRWQMRNVSENINYAYLRHLLEEFEHNKKILHNLKTYIGSGPIIDHLWAPAEINASSLRTEAWDSLIRAGVLPIFSENEQRSLSITNRTVKDVKRKIKEIAANWHRIREWREYDLKNKNPQPTSVKVFQDSAIPEAIGSVDYSIKRLDEGIILIKQILDNIGNNKEVSDKK